MSEDLLHRLLDYYCCMHDRAKSGGLIGHRQADFSRSTEPLNTDDRHAIQEPETVVCMENTVIDELADVVGERERGNSACVHPYTLPLAEDES